MKKMKTLTVNGQQYTIEDPDGVSYGESQSLTDEQKATARANIGAAAKGDGTTIEVSTQEYVGADLRRGTQINISTKEVEDGLSTTNMQKVVVYDGVNGDTITSAEVTVLEAGSEPTAELVPASVLPNEKKKILQLGIPACDNGYIDDYFGSFEFTDGALINADGKAVSHSSYSYTTFVPRDAKTVRITAFISGIAAIAFVNGETVLSYYRYPETEGQAVELEIPEHCTHVRASCATAAKEKFCVQARLADVIKTGEEKHVSKYIDITPTQWEEGKFIMPSGTISTNSGYCLSDYIPIFPFTSITGMYAIQSAAAWVLYDVHKKVIKAYDNPSSAFVPTSSMQTVDTTGAHYIRFTCIANKLNSFRAYAEYDPAILQTLPNRLAAELPFLKPNDRPLPVEDMPESGGYMAIFDKIGVVGDSLSSGTMTCENGNHNPMMFNYSWIQYLARMCGSTAINFSRGGLATDTFLANSGKLLDKLTNPENKCKCYFVALGHNDRNHSLPVGTAADIDIADYNNNANTYYGNYAGIIQRIKEVEPNAIIFPITMKLSQFETEGWNGAVRYMAEIFDNVYVLDMYAYYKDVPSWHYTEGHGNAMGYLWYSKEIACYVDWIVRSNPEKFKYVQFIGTEYAEYIPQEK